MVARHARRASSFAQRARREAGGGGLRHQGGRSGLIRPSPAATSCSRSSTPAGSQLNARPSNKRQLKPCPLAAPRSEPSPPPHAKLLCAGDDRIPNHRGHRQPRFKAEPLKTPERFPAYQSKVNPMKKSFPSWIAPNRLGNRGGIWDLLSGPGASGRQPRSSEEPH